MIRKLRMRTKFLTKLLTSILKVGSKYLCKYLTIGLPSIFTIFYFLCSKSSWEKYYACLTANAITIYEEPPNNDSVKVVKSLDLKPADSYGKVIMEPVVSEIGIPVANSDLPFVLKVEVSPNTTCWPPKYLIFMTLSIENRDKWYKGR